VGGGWVEGGWGGGGVGWVGGGGGGGRGVGWGWVRGGVWGGCGGGGRGGWGGGLGLHQHQFAMSGHKSIELPLTDIRYGETAMRFCSRRGGT